jgi:outer membrane lipoprotein-sorting protein
MPGIRPKSKGCAMRAASVILVFALGLATPALAAAPDADAILKRAFDNYRADTSQATVAMTVHRPAWERRLEMKSWTRGDNDALVRFTAPAKDAGNATLKLARDTWVYNPKLNQVIQLPASMMSQSWMGSDFSYNDLSKSEDLLTLYGHRLVATDQAGGHTVWTIEAIPKPGAPVVWGKVAIKVRDDYVVIEETFFDQDMKPARRMQTESVGVLGGRPYPVSMSMHPLDQPAQWTRIDTAEARFNTSVPAYLFTLSNLQNPRP